MNELILFELVDLIYRAAQDTPQWQRFLDALSRAAGDAAVAMSLTLPDIAIPEYQFRAHQQAKLCPFLEKHMRRGLVWGSLEDPIYRQRFARQFVSSEALRSSEIYAEWMEPQGMAPEGPISHVIACHGGRPVSAISLFRREGCRPLTDDDLALFDQLVPHLHQAYGIHQALEEGRRQQSALSGVLDRMPLGIALLDVEHRVVLSNQSARQILSQEDGLCLTGDRIAAADRDEDIRLHRSIDQCARAARGKFSASEMLAISRPSGGRSFAVNVYPLKEAEQSWSAADAVVSLLLTDPETVQVSTAEVLRRLYSLTPAEADLIRLLIEGMSVEQIAERRGVAVSTVRSQVKTIYAKTGARRRGELVRLVLGGVAALREE